MVSQVDLHDLLHKGSIAVTPHEHDDERAARILRDNRDHMSGLTRSWLIFLIVAIFILTVAYFSLDTLLFAQNPKPHAVEWAKTALTSLLTGFLSFWLGRSTK